MKFIGYYSGWDKCHECGMRLVKVGDVLKHRSGWLKAHHEIKRRKAVA